MVKDKTFYLIMAEEMEDKEKEKTRACLAQVRRDHQVCSSSDEHEEPENKRKSRKLCMIVTSDDDGSTNL